MIRMRWFIGTGWFIGTREASWWIVVVMMMINIIMGGSWPIIIIIVVVVVGGAEKTTHMYVFQYDKSNPRIRRIRIIIGSQRKWSPLHREIREERREKRRRALEGPWGRCFSWVDLALSDLPIIYYYCSTYVTFPTALTILLHTHIYTYI